MKKKPDSATKHPENLGNDTNNQVSNMLAAPLKLDSDDTNSQPITINSTATDETNNPELSPRAKNAWSTFNFFQIFIGVHYVGILAGLLIYQGLKGKVPEWQRITFAIITYVNNLLGKESIVYLFNNPVFIALINQIYQQGWRYFLPTKNLPLTHRLGNLTIHTIALFTNIFWAGLAQLTHKLLQSELNESDSAFLKTMADIVGNDFLIIFLGALTFEVNAIAWPAVINGGYQFSKRAIRYWFEPRIDRNFKTNTDYLLNRIHILLLKEMDRALTAELKRIKQRANDDVFEDESGNFLTAESTSTTPLLDNLIIILEKNIQNLGINEDDDRTKLASQTLKQKIEYAVSLMADPQQVRLAYLNLVDQRQLTDLTTVEWLARHTVALLVTGIGIAGFRNFLPLSHQVWKQWGLENVSIYFAGPATFLSGAELVAITLYPLFYYLVGMAIHEIHPALVSKLAFAALGVGAALVGIGSGAANGEQSRIAGEMFLLTVIALLTSALLDTYSIFVVVLSMLWERISQSTQQDLHTLTKQAILSFREKSVAAINFESITQDEWEDLAEFVKRLKEGVSDDRELDKFSEENNNEENEDPLYRHLLTSQSNSNNRVHSYGSSCTQFLKKFWIFNCNGEKPQHRDDSLEIVGPRFEMG
ncbi:MAG: hypothetical protein Tsb005_09150 [Gammaproteobacteria bacterium]